MGNSVLARGSFVAAFTDAAVLKEFLPDMMIGMIPLILYGVS
jgi:hypothetical protein